MTNMERCGRDLTGLPEWVRADYYQAHRDHGCLFSDSDAEPVAPARLDAIVSVRLTSDELAYARALADVHGTTISGVLRLGLSRIPRFSVRVVS